MKITFKRTPHGPGYYCAYKGETLFATLSGATPTKTNGRQAQWNICYLTGRVEWFDTLVEAKDYVRKG